MLVNFNDLSPTSRLWIFQSDRKFKEEEESIISSILSSFTSQWAAHGNPMKASFELRHGHFIILAADEDHSAASGCSIDDSVRTVKGLGAKLGIDFFNRNLIAFRKADGSIDLVDIKELKSQFLAGRWNTETPTFNNLIAEKAALSQWIIPAGQTWLSRYVTSQPVAP